ncbi:hypothetical protein CYMTET_38337 [Cymbomonas tetramitiformis]|uniref:Cytochrome b5 heme-binding domain-containing protein n=1 Tax=Cymbomonas tetramitiformis TaxID=36881 RepID=A0AAE0CDR8_9CHLO|nr:hypothetical protein CYMTET_38337 [Cymbomonas tetramitiformis]
MASILEPSALFSQVATDTLYVTALVASVWGVAAAFKKKKTQPDVWKVHGKYYDLTKFLDKHPGGSAFLEIAKNTDITALFESHHVHDADRIRETILPKYEITEPEAMAKGWIPIEGAPEWDFSKGGFFKETQKGVAEALPKSILSKHDWWYDSFILFAAVLSWFAVYNVFFNPSYKAFWYTVTFFSRVTVVSGAGHYYLHSGESWREIFWDFYSPMSSWVWKYEHCISHHIHTSTQYDLQMSGPRQIRKFPGTPNPIRVFLLFGVSPFLTYLKNFGTFVETGAPLKYYLYKVPMFVEFIIAYRAGMVVPYAIFIALAAIYSILFLFCSHQLPEQQLAVSAKLLNEKHLTTAPYIKDNLKVHPRDWGLHQMMTSKDFYVTGNYTFDNFIMIIAHNQVAHHFFPIFNPLHYEVVEEVISKQLKKFNLPHEYIEKRSFVGCVPELVSSLCHHTLEDFHEIFTGAAA